MKAIVNTAPGRLEWRECATPEPGPGQVRVRTAACGICATDLEMIAGWERTGFPAIPGHEWSGMVDAAGPGVDKSLVGRRCVAENVWADGREVGFEHAGGYAEFLLTEAANIYPLPGQFPAETAALIEPLAVCVRGLSRLRPERTDAALVMGDGPIGLICLMLLKARGFGRVVLIGGKPARLKLARELGADVAVNYQEVGGSGGKGISGGTGILPVDGPQVHAQAVMTGKMPVPPKLGTFPNVIEASGSPAGAERALELADRGGKILVLGDYGQGRAEFPWNRVLHRELSIVGSNASAGAWPEAVRLATTKALPLGKLVSRRLAARDFAEGVELTRGREVVKVVLDWSGDGKD